MMTFDPRIARTMPTYSVLAVKFLATYSLCMCPLLLDFKVYTKPSSLKSQYRDSACYCFTLARGYTRNYLHARQFLGGMPCSLFSRFPDPPPPWFYTIHWQKQGIGAYLPFSVTNINIRASKSLASRTCTTKITAYIHNHHTPVHTAPSRKD